MLARATQRPFVTAAGAVVGVAVVTVAMVRCCKRYLCRRALLQAWERDGYVIIKQLLSPTECARLEAAVTCDGGIQERAHGRDDGMGRQTRMALWNHPGNDVTW